jgi:DNA-binding response OmpR family regulator
MPFWQDGVAQMKTPLDVILVINDYPKHLVLLTTHLLLMNYQVVTASIKKDALEIARRLQPMLISLDIDLGDNGELDSLTLFRQESSLCDTPILIISAMPVAHYREQAIALGANGYLMKPFSVEQLRQFVGGYLDRRQAV